MIKLDLIGLEVIGLEVIKLEIIGLEMIVNHICIPLITSKSYPLLVSALLPAANFTLVTKFYSLK